MEIDDLALDKEGYLQNLSAWTPEVATSLAQAEGITLDERHFQLIDLVRSYYQRTEVSPAMRPLVKLVREALGKEFGNSIYLMSLFPGSPAKLLAKVAGLPRPTNCL